MLRGREIIHKNIAINMMNKIENKLKKNNKNIFFINKTIENRQITIILIQKKK